MLRVASCLVLLAACLLWPSAASADSRVLTKDVKARIEKFVADHKYRDARKHLDLIGIKVARRPAREQKELEALRTTVEKARRVWLEKELETRFAKKARELIAKRAAEKEVTSTTALRWVTRTLPGLLGKGIAADLAAHVKLSPKQVFQAWRNRKPGQWHIFVFPVGGQSPIVEQRERWWKRASVAHRTDRMFQAFLLGSDLFELGKKDPKVACGRCKGTGFETHVGRNGRHTYSKCARCRGAKYAPATRWR